MSANPNWPRWIFASVAKYLKDTCETADLPSIVEGVEDRTDTYMAETDRAEIRISGPFVRPMPGHHYQIRVPANVLISSRYDEGKNKFSDSNFLGELLNAMDSVIPVYKMGNLAGDDPDEQIGCLSVAPKTEISIYHFGQIEKTDRLKQSLIDAVYYGEFSANEP